MKDGGSIIVTGSGLWQKGVPVYATYAATKAGLRSFVRTWTARMVGTVKLLEKGWGTGPWAGGPGVKSIVGTPRASYTPSVRAGQVRESAIRQD